MIDRSVLYARLLITKLSRCRACSRVIAAKPSHRAASAAKEKGSAGPVRRLRETGTLSEIGHEGSHFIRKALKLDFSCSAWFGWRFILQRPKYLYHGSSKYLNIIMPFQAYDWGYSEGCQNAVYATSNKDIALGFALGAVPDEFGRIGRIMDKKYGNETKMIFYQGHPNFGGKGYVYKLSSDGFIYTGGTQWVNRSAVIPIEVLEIEVDDYLYLFRYATSKERQEIEDEFNSLSSIKNE